MPDIKYEITQSIACLSEEKSGWTKELNLVSWNGNEPKYDIRTWGPEHKNMGKGITLTNQEIISLYEILSKEVEFLRS